MAILVLPTLEDTWFDHVDRVSRRMLGLHDVRGAALARAVARVSQLYTRERPQLSQLQGDDEALCARLKFFLSRDLLKLHGPIAELASVNAFPARRRLRVLDLGAGLGATSLGLARSLHALALADRIDLTAVDSDPAALELLSELCADVSSLPGVPMVATTQVANLATGWPSARGPRYDVILLGLVLNELAAVGGEHAAEYVARYLATLCEQLADDGVLIAIEPALRETSRVLHAARDRLAAQPGPGYVFAPCLNRQLGCPMLARERDYCHERVPCVLPERIAEVARAAGLRDTDLTYSYLTLHRAPRSLRELVPATTLLRAVSGALPSKGKVELWLCGASVAPRGMLLTRHVSEANAAFTRAERGSVLQIEPTPQDRDAARLRVGADTRVELVQTWQTAADEHSEVAER